MALLFLVACLASTTLVFGEDYGMIDICNGRRVKWVKPGDDFNIPCKSDTAVQTKIHPPRVDPPSDAQLLEDATDLAGNRPERTTYQLELENATKGRHDGVYTCVVQHGGVQQGSDVSYSLQECEVIIVDLCENSRCEEDEVCEADYKTGTHICTCNYDCPQAMDPVCSDTCEMHWNECVMRETSCKDRKARSVESKGFCPGKVEPKFRRINQDIECKLGETVNLASGLIKDGTPRASIQWVFHPEQGSVTYLDVIDNYEVECSDEAAGVYKITLMHCMDAENAMRNEYRLTVEEPPIPIVEPQHVCSLYPGGVLEDFNSDAHFYDLACTHVLAADFMPGGDYTNSWFVYGTFDKLDGKTALSAMTFYLPSGVFGFMRGWIVNMADGSKLALEEGVAQDLGASGCQVTFSEPEEESVSKRHLRLVCPHINLEAYYDGIMAGHIKLTTDGTPKGLKKGKSNIGLCFDNDKLYHRRTNWQIMNTKGKCKIDGDKQKCSDVPAPKSCDLYEDKKRQDFSWSTCGDGASEACKELQCEGNAPTAAQKCALEQANRMNCDLKTGKDDSKVDESCLYMDDCEWMEHVVSTGCPQDNLPFVCPRG